MSHVTSFTYIFSYVYSLILLSSLETLRKAMTWPGSSTGCIVRLPYVVLSINLGWCWDPYNSVYLLIPIFYTCVVLWLHPINVIFGMCRGTTWMRRARDFLRKVMWRCCVVVLPAKASLGWTDLILVSIHSLRLVLNKLYDNGTFIMEILYFLKRLYHLETSYNCLEVSNLQISLILFYLLFLDFWCYIIWVRHWDLKVPCNHFRILWLLPTSPSVIITDQDSSCWRMYVTLCRTSAIWCWSSHSVSL